MTGRSAPLIYALVRDVSGNAERVLDQTHRIRSLTYTDSEKKADHAVLEVENFDLSNFDDVIWSHGNLIDLQWGYAGAMSLTRRLVIQRERGHGSSKKAAKDNTVTGFTTLKVQCVALSLLLDAVKRSRTFENMTRSEVVAKIATENGYAADTQLIEATTTRFPHIVQARLSDAQMIRRLAHLQGFAFYVDYDGFHFHERKLVQPVARTFTYYTAKVAEVLDITVDIDVTRRPVGVARTHRDPITKEERRFVADNAADTSREGLGAVLVQNSADLSSGGFLSANAPGYVPQSYTPTDGCGVASSCMPAGHWEVVERDAKAAFRAATRNTVKIGLEAIGDASTFAKTIVRVDGVGDRLTGNYYVAEVEHKVAPGSYTMHLKLESDGTSSATKKTTADNGLPEVAAVQSSARRPAAIAPSTSGPNQSFDPSTLSPDPLVAWSFTRSDGTQVTQFSTSPRPVATVPASAEVAAGPGYSEAPVVVGDIDARQVAEENAQRINFDIPPA
jgi:phage protein D